MERLTKKKAIWNGCVATYRAYFWQLIKKFVTLQVLKLIMYIYY